MVTLTAFIGTFFIVARNLFLSDVITYAQLCYFYSPSAKHFINWCDPPQLWHRSEPPPFDSLPEDPPWSR
jgi:hypothetical protein